MNDTLICLTNTEHINIFKQCSLSNNFIIIIIIHYTAGIHETYKKPVDTIFNKQKI